MWDCARKNENFLKMLVFFVFLCLKCVNQLTMRQRCFYLLWTWFYVCQYKIGPFDGNFRKWNFLTWVRVVDTFALARCLKIHSCFAIIISNIDLIFSFQWKFIKWVGEYNISSGGRKEIIAYEKCVFRGRELSIQL